MEPSITVRRAVAHDYPRILSDLADLLIACVQSGASVSFLHPLPQEKARTFWLQVASEIRGGARIQLVAENKAGQILGTVQLAFAQPENQPHRAEVSKLLVHPAARRQGIGERLMRELERIAQSAGKTLLVLDTASADAERLYLRLGWRLCGRIPGYALSPLGDPCATNIYYRDLLG